LPPVSYDLVLSNRQKDTETVSPVKYHCGFPSSIKRPSLTHEIWCCLPHQWAVWRSQVSLYSLCCRLSSTTLSTQFHYILDWSSNPSPLDAVFMWHAVQNRLFFSMAHFFQFLRVSAESVSLLSRRLPLSVCALSHWLSSCRHKLFSHWFRRSYNRSVVVRLLLVPSPLIYFGFPGQTSLLANESAILIFKSETTLIPLMLSTQWDSTPLQTSGASKPLSYLHGEPDYLKYFPLLFPPYPVYRKLSAFVTMVDGHSFLFLLVLLSEAKEEFLLVPTIIICRSLSWNSGVLILVPF